MARFRLETYFSGVICDVEVLHYYMMDTIIVVTIQHCIARNIWPYSQCSVKSREAKYDFKTILIWRQK